MPLKTPHDTAIQATSLIRREFGASFDVAILQTLTVFLREPAFAIFGLLI